MNYIQRRITITKGIISKTRRECKDDEQVVMENTVGKMEYVCGKCDAMMFKDEMHKYIHKESNQLSLVLG